MNQQTIKTIAEAAAASVVTSLGLTSGEISLNRAKAVYGRWFVEAAAAGRIKPVRQGQGRTATKWYRIYDILTLKAADESQAEIQLESIK